MRRRVKVSKSVLAGTAAGLAGAYLMNQWQALLPHQKPGSGDDATVKTANAISRTIFHHDLTKREKKWAGPAVHYAFGGLLGALYGAWSAKMPMVKSGLGTAYGAAVWLGADEVAVPAARLAPSVSETPVSIHAKALASHLVYGLTTDLLRRAILKVA